VRDTDDTPAALAGLANLYDDCIHCGLCLEHCPTYRESLKEGESPRGRIYGIRALAEGRLDPNDGTTAQLDSCVGCRACETACPAGVQYGTLLEMARERFVEPQRPPGARRLFWRSLLRHILPYRNRLKVAVLPGLWAARVLVKRGFAAAWLPEVAKRLLELLPPKPKRVPVPEWTPAQGVEKGTVALMNGCAMPVFFGDVDAATVRVLSKAGFRVWVPPMQGCCGAIHLHDGDRQGARALARDNLAVLKRFPLDHIVSHSGGCSATLHEYASLLADDPEWAERARQFTAKVVDFSSLIAQSDIQWPTAAPNQPPVRVTWHDPCHLVHGLKVKEAPRAIIRQVPNVEFVELVEADWCCGGAGSYTLLQAERSDKLLTHKLQHIQATQASIVLTANPPCLMQIGRGLRQAEPAPTLMHLALWLDSLDESHHG